MSIAKLVLFILCIVAVASSKELGSDSVAGGSTGLVVLEVLVDGNRMIPPALRRTNIQLTSTCMINLVVLVMDVNAGAS